MIEIDGAQGEGGGQILRTALSLSIITGMPMYIKGIRAKRPKPGLRPQHLKAVDAAAAVSKATVKGSFLDSDSLTFIPSGIRTGRYKFDIGTAGSTSLVLQTIFLPLSLAKSASSVIITGGTHVHWSPCFHYLDFQWLPYLKQIGFDANLVLDQAGFYPRGGGRVSATILPIRQFSPLLTIDRGRLIRISGISAVANLKMSIAHRQKRQAYKRLYDSITNLSLPDIKIKSIAIPSRNKGTLLLIHAQFESGSCCYYALGERSKPAEQVADEAVNAFISFLDSDGSVDQYLADQLLLPLSMVANDSIISTSQVTQHLLTNANIIKMFIPVKIEIPGELGKPSTIQILHD
jgi:RNA 3'-terminal phosphate cyclase (ATP)